jgi:putative flippase GtrA
MDPVLRGPRAVLAPALLVRFALVGLGGTAVYYALLWSLVELGGVPVLGASTFAFGVVVVENYLLHRCWTFASRVPHRAALPRFVLLAGCGAAVNGAVMGACQRLGWHYLLAQALALALVVACNLAGTLSIFRSGRRA